MTVLSSFSAVDVQTGLVGLTTFLATRWLLAPRSRKRLPRGPRGFPVLGNAVRFWGNDYLHIQLDTWAKEFGDVYTVRLGSYEMVVVSSEEAIRELMVDKGEQTDHRPRLVIHRLMDASHGILNNMGAPWREQRRMAITALRDFGVGKMTIEQRILEESQRIICRLDECDGQPIDLHTSFISASSNIICSIIFGERYNYDDKEFQKMMGYLDKIFSQGGLKNVGMYLTALLLLLPLFLPFSIIAIGWVQKLKRFFYGKIEDHRASFDESNIRDFVDLYIQAEQSTTDKKLHSDKEVFFTIIDLFAAGSETSSTTLRWCLLYLVQHTDVQEKLRTEILEVIGGSRSPAYSDHNKMPYTQAVIEETLRLGNVAPHTLAHMTNQTVEFRDDILPPGTMIIANMYSVHRDSENFPDPLEFRPARWLNSAGNFTKHHSFMAFGLGPRECPGKSLAYQEIFLLLTSLIQQFRFTASEPESLPSTQGRLGITHHPDSYKVKAHRI